MAAQRRKCNNRSGSGGVLSLRAGLNDHRFAYSPFRAQSRATEDQKHLGDLTRRMKLGEWGIYLGEALRPQTLKQPRLNLGHQCI